MARKKGIGGKQTAAARNKVASKQAAIQREKHAQEKLAKKKQTAKRVAQQEQLERKEKMETKRNKTQSIIILCACGAAAIIISNWPAISGALGL